MSKPAFEYIVVEGPIGAGKTLLAKGLAATLDNDLLLERAADNPFLPRFYEDPQTAALPAQLYFLFERVKQLKALRQKDLFASAKVANFLIQKDRVFAGVVLDPDELELYRQVYDHLVSDAPTPDLVIYLQAPVPLLLQRIHERGAPYEKNITEDYLRKISAAYVDFFYNYNDSPLLVVNVEELDFAAAGSCELLLDFLNHRLGPGRHYFNPREIMNIDDE